MIRDGNRSAVPPHADIVYLPKMPEWTPFEVRKQVPVRFPQHSHSQQAPPTRIQRLRNRALIAALAVFLLYPFINMIFLNVPLVFVDTCLPLLAALSPSTTTVYPVALAATQFCGLRSMWKDAGQQAQAMLEAGGLGQ
jgi:hypothetical protein